MHMPSSVTYATKLMKRSLVIGLVERDVPVVFHALERECMCVVVGRLFGLARRKVHAAARKRSFAHGVDDVSADGHMQNLLRSILPARLAFSRTSLVKSSATDAPSAVRRRVGRRKGRSSFRPCQEVRCESARRKLSIAPFVPALCCMLFSVRNK